MGVMGKQRKGQLVEEYQAQKQQFYSEGPTINDDTTCCDIDGLDMAKKPDRNQVLYVVQRCYYTRDYTKCLHIANQAIDKFRLVDGTKADKQMQELLDIREKCEEKLQ